MAIEAINPHLLKAGHDRTSPVSAQGEMAELIHRFDWSATPCGAFRKWPGCLATAVDIILGSRFPMFVWWGDEMINIYNDAYAPLLGKRHPTALGRPAREVWADVWPICGPQAEAVLREGKSTWNEELLLIMERNGYTEEAYFTFSYSPVKDDSGRPAGVFCAVTEDTARVLSRRRLKTLRDLGEGGLAEGLSDIQACRAAAKALSRNLNDFPFALIYLLDADGHRCRLCDTVNYPRDHRGSPAEVILNDADDVWGFAQVLKTSHSFLFQDLDRAFRSMPAGPWNEDRPTAALVLPLAKPGVQDLPAGFLVAGLSPRLAFNDDYRSFLELSAGHIATAIANARAYQEERKRAEALAEVDRAKTAFFSNVSHEFRTPLTLMLGPLEELLSAENGALRADQREQLQLTHRNSLRLLKLVNTLLDFSRIEAGRVEAKYEATDLAGFTAELCAVFRAAMEKAGLRLVVNCPPLPEPVYVDRDLWEKIVLNLLSNAFKFTFEGEISVHLQAFGRGVELSIRDTGTGIPENELANVFKRFHRIEGARGRSFEGSGIGLALVHEIVRLHGGQIRVKSELGKGTEFIISVPLGRAHLPPERIRADGGLKAPNLSKAEAFVEEALRWLPDGEPLNPAAERPDVISLGLDGARPSTPGLNGDSVLPRVLVADDNADMRDYLRRVLAPLCEVITVPDGEAAFVMARKHRPDLILSDVMMPRWDGLALLRAIRADPHLQTTPIILLSARSAEESRVQGLAAGADDYLAKPFSARELAARVDSHIKMARLRQEAFERERKLRDEVETQRGRAVEVIESITDGFIALDFEWRFTYLNHSAERLLGRGARELLGKNIWDEYPATRGATVDRELRRASDEQISVEFENFYEPWQRWFEARAYPAANGLTVYFRDITERKKAAEALDSANRRLAEQVDGLSRLHELSTRLLTTRDKESMLLSILESMVRLHDTDRGLLSLVSDRGDFLHVGASLNFGQAALEKLEKIPVGIGACGTAFAERRRVIVEDTETDPVFAPHRELARELGFRAVHSTPILARDGRPLGVLSVQFPHPHRPSAVQVQLADMYARQAADFMEQGRVERALELSEERFRLAAFADAITMYEQDRDLRYLWLYPNHPEHEHALGKTDTDILPNEQGRELAEWKREVMASGQPQRREARTDLSSGARVYDVFILPRRNGAGEITGVAGTALDITERKAAEAALRESQERLATELRGTTLLYELGKDCVAGAKNFQHCLERVVEVAISVTGADKGNLQLLDKNSGALRIAAQRGFEREFLEHFSAVSFHSGAACAAAMQSGTRVIVEDVTISAVFAGSPSLPVMLAAGARAVQSTPLISSAGNLLGMISTHYSQPHIPSGRELRMIDLLARQAADYIERRQVEDALHESEIRLRTMAESLPNLVWTCLPDGQCDWLSSQWGKYTGIPPKDLLGLNWLERVVHPDDRARTIACWRAACEDRGAYDLEYRIRRHDSRYRWFKTRGVPVRDAHGKITYWFGTCTDIEEIKQAHLAIQRLAAIVEHSDDAIFGLDLEGIIQSWNRGAERIYGYSAEEALGQSINLVIPESWRDQESRLMDKIRGDQSVEHVETQRRRKDGVLFDVALTVSPIKDAEGRIIGVSKIARDITDKVRAKEKLEQAVAERTESLREAVAQMEEFSYSVSHDLRSPVRAIQGYATALAEDYGGELNDEARHYLDRIIQASGRMERLIHDVLTYSRVNRMEVHLQPVCLEDLLRGVISQYPELHPDRADIAVPSRLATVLAHESSLGQAVANLLTNAVKFVPPGVRPAVRILSETSAGQVIVRFQDNGIGIKPEHQGRLFGMFERVHPEGQYEGTGIGLAIVRKTVERMGGKVGVESDGVNGSTFWIALPQSTGSTPSSTGAGS